MARKVKCKICKSEGTNETFYKVNNNGNNSYYCSQEEFEQYTKDKEDYTRLMRFIALDVLEYEDGQIVPPSMVKKIKSLHKFYEYEVIHKCFEESKETVQYWIKNKDFTNEFGMVSYIMKIIEGNINDVLKQWKYKQYREIKQDKKKKELIVDFDVVEQAYENKKQSNNDGILSFLDEGDL